MHQRTQGPALATAADRGLSETNVREIGFANLSVGRWIRGCGAGGGRLWAWHCIVVLFLVACPLASAATEAFRFHETLANSILIGRFTAGIRQVVQPRFTAEEIFGIRDTGALPIDEVHFRSPLLKPD
jgi:hypothetical protein